jgi:single-strand DNA-binding protein
MASLNKVSIIGRVGQDPKIAYTSDGKAVAKLSLACSETWKDKNGQKQEKTEWIPVSIFGKLAEIVQQYVRTGSQLYIEGKYTTRKWTNKEGKDQWTTEVILSGFGGVLQMLDSKGDKPVAEFVPPVGDPITPVESVAGDPFGDDIPFNRVSSNPCFS